MAKAKTFDQAIDELLNNWSDAIGEAAVYATKKAEEDFYNHSMKFLEQYYDQYDPIRYKRSDSLRHAFVKFSNVKRHSKTIQCEAGVVYDAWLLEDYVGANNNYAYDASKKYGQVDGDFVINNYLEGLHPYTSGSTEPGTPIQYHQYYSPTSKMREEMENYGPTFQKNLLMSFAIQIKNIMKG